MKKTISIPSKVMLLGEYAVLAGQPAWLCAIGPRFRVTVGDNVPSSRADDGPHPFAPPPESPAGRFLASRSPCASESRVWLDPHGGRGGFGGSTAEFLAAFVSVEPTFLPPDDGGTTQIWRAYRALTRHSPGGVPPSGADLISQARGGMTEIWIERATGYGDVETPCFREVLPGLRDTGMTIEIFSAASKPGRKVATHVHLAGIDSVPSELAKRCGDLVRKALRATHADELGVALTEYERALQAFDLVSADALEDSRALREADGTFGAKGCGAMLSDALVALTSKPGAARRAAAARGLEWVASIGFGEAFFREGGARAE